MPKRLTPALLAILLIAAPALAQVPQNPGTGHFKPSPDHATVTRYESGIWLLGGFSQTAAPTLGPTSIGKPTPNAAGEIDFLFSIVPIASGNYEMKVRAVTVVGTTTFTSVWGGGGTNNATVPLDRAVLPPTDLRLP